MDGFTLDLHRLHQNVSALPAAAARNRPAAACASIPTRCRAYGSATVPRWRVATRERLDLQLLELMPPLAALCPPTTVIDKTRYSAFAELRLIEHLRQREADALVVSRSETDVCVLATVLDAVDTGGPLDKTEIPRDSLLRAGSSIGASHKNCAPPHQDCA